MMVYTSLMVNLCKIEDCTSRVEGWGYCNKHYQRFKKYGDPLFTKPHGSPRPKGSANPKYLTGEKLNYWVAHRRVKAARGSASEQTCPCGQPAREWSYDKTDPNPLHGPTKLGSPYSADYSEDVTRYIAMCVLCHRRFDRGVI